MQTVYLQGPGAGFVLLCKSEAASPSSLLTLALVPHWPCKAEKGPQETWFCVGTQHIQDA